MISHVFVAITDFERAFNFYSAIINALGLRLKFSEPDQPWAGWTAAEGVAELQSLFASVPPPLPPA